MGYFGIWVIRASGNFIQPFFGGGRLLWIMMMWSGLVLVIFTLSTQVDNNFEKNLGHNLHKMCKIVSFGCSLS